VLTRHVRIVPDADELACAVAGYMAGAAIQAIKAQGRFTVALAGGSTPRGAYEQLASGTFAKHVDWSRVHVFWSDERCVPPDDERSNYRMADEALLSRVPIPQDNVHRINGEVPPDEAAADYELTLKEGLGAEGGFDLVMLGLGQDGHTASLFPGDAAVEEHERWVVPVAAPDVEPCIARVTLTLPVINASNRVAFVAAGTSKSAIVREVMQQAETSSPGLPAAQVRPRGELVWFLDEAAGAGVRPS
jgi:6-phosphogluconolactonase